MNISNLNLLGALNTTDSTLPRLDQTIENQEFNNELAQRLMNKIQAVLSAESFNNSSQAGQNLAIESSGMNASATWAGNRLPLASLKSDDQELQNLVQHLAKMMEAEAENGVPEMDADTLTLKLEHLVNKINTVQQSVQEHEGLHRKLLELVEPLNRFKAQFNQALTGVTDSALAVDSPVADQVETSTLTAEFESFDSGNREPETSGLIHESESAIQQPASLDLNPVNTERSRPEQKEAVTHFSTVPDESSIRNAAEAFSQLIKNGEQIIQDKAHRPSSMQASRPLEVQNAASNPMLDLNTSESQEPEDRPIEWVNRPESTRVASDIESNQTQVRRQVTEAIQVMPVSGSHSPSRVNSERTETEHPVDLVSQMTALFETGRGNQDIARGQNQAQVLEHSSEKESIPLPVSNHVATTANSEPFVDNPDVAVEQAVDLRPQTTPASRQISNQANRLNLTDATEPVILTESGAANDSVMHFDPVPMDSAESIQNTETADLTLKAEHLAEFKSAPSIENYSEKPVQNTETADLTLKAEHLAEFKGTPNIETHPESVSESNVQNVIEQVRPSTHFDSVPMDSVKPVQDTKTADLTPDRRSNPVDAVVTPDDTETDVQVVMQQLDRIIDKFEQIQDTIGNIQSTTDYSSVDQQIEDVIHELQSIQRIVEQPALFKEIEQFLSQQPEPATAIQADNDVLPLDIMAIAASLSAFPQEDQPAVLEQKAVMASAYYADQQGRGAKPATSLQTNHQSTTVIAEEIPLELRDLENSNKTKSAIDKLQNQPANVSGQELEFTDKNVSRFAMDLANLNRAMLMESRSEVPPMSKHFAHPEWNQEMGEKILWMVKQEIPSAELRLNPRHLGPVTIRLDVKQDQVSVAFTTQHAAVKDAIEAAMPKLREMFTAQNLNLTDVNVSQDSSSEQRSSRSFAQMENQTGQRRQGQSDGAELNAEHNDVADLTEEIEAGRAMSANGLLSIFA